jgi:hypothetical protein
VSLKVPPVGVEPTVSRLEGGCLIHLATEADVAEDSFDLSTFGLWAQRASTAPLCLLSCQDAMLPLVRLEV